MPEKDWRLFLKEHPSELLKTVDPDLLRNLLKDFTVATGLTANIITTEGKSIFNRKDAQNNCNFCKIVRELERKKGMNRCVGAYRRAGIQAARYGEPSIFRCPAGLVEWVSPIVLEGIHIGSLVCGQVLMWEPEEFFWIELNNLNSCLTDDLEPLMAAARELQVVPADKVQAASRLMSILANSIMGLVWEEIRRKSEARYQKELLEKEKGMRLELEKQLNVYSMSYYRDQTRSLIAATSSRNFEKARSIVTVIIADIINRNDEFDYAHTQMYDMMFMLSRVAIDSGAESEECMRIMTDHCSVARYVSSLEGLGHAAGETAERLISEMETAAGTHKPAVEAMCGYIKAHLSVTFSVKDVADTVDLSPYYASRIFKEDTGITIMEYATKARINEAKYLLTNPKFRVEEVAAQVGYTDPSYFGRVFKKQVGMSPRQYRMCH